MASQRGRLLLGMAEAVAEKGYTRTSVAEVLKRVHVSRETFYEHFADKEACFLAAFDKAGELLEAGVREAAGPPELPPMERFDRALTAYLDLMVSEPALAKMFLTEIYAAGRAAADRRVDVQRRWVNLFTEILTADERWRTLPDPHFACSLVVGGVGAMVTARVAIDDHASLPALREPILALIHSVVDR
ncbi:MAG: Transcriptional regulator, TetR family [Actinomycetia bacterium]|nr:Transcriptional regulator, TetR family [Actinomycetes bacterium]